MANADPFIRNIYARKDFRLVTAYEQVDMKATEDRLVRFGSQADYESLLELDLFVECINNLPSAPIVSPTTLPQPQTELDADAVVQSALSPVRAEQDVEMQHEAKVITQQDDNILCPKCNNPMILSIGTADPANIKDVMYCPGCTYTYATGTRPADHVQEPPEVTPAPQVGTVESVVPNMPEPRPAPPARKMSRCECGKVKAVASALCKNCTADMVDDSTS